MIPEAMPWQHRLLLRRWPDGMVVFDRLLGDTHALDERAAALLEAWLADSAQALESVAERLGLSDRTEALQAVLKPMILSRPLSNA